LKHTFSIHKNSQITQQSPNQVMFALQLHNK